MLRSLSLVSLVLLAVVLSSAKAQLATLSINLRRRSTGPSIPPEQRNVVTLSCTRDDFDPIADLSFHYRDPNNIVTELPYEVHDENRITFMITPDTEGNYFCRASGATDSDDLPLTAYPIPDETISQITEYAAQKGIGTRVTLPCDFEEGAQSQAYSYVWFNSNGIINTQNPKYVVTESSSLIINDLEESDNDTYMCKVTVNNLSQSGNDFMEFGRLITLEVFDAAKVVVKIESQVVREGDSSEPFTCVAQGTPRPTIEWTFNGSVIGNSAVERSLFDATTTETSVDTITSTLTVRNAQNRDNAEVVCTAINQLRTLTDTFRNSSNANLTVLPKQVNGLVLASAASSDFTKAFVDFNLSHAILGKAWLHVRYLGETIEANRNELYPQAIVVNTRFVHFELPEEHWRTESFSTFRVRVALTAPNEVNPSDDQFTASSNPVTISDEFRFSHTLIFVIIGVGGGVLILSVLIVVGGIVCCCKYYTTRKQKETAADDVPRAGAPDGDGDEEVPLPWQADYYMDFDSEDPWQADYYGSEECKELLVKSVQMMVLTVDKEREQRKEDGGMGDCIVADCSDDEGEEKGKGEGRIGTCGFSSYERLSEHLSSPSSICSPPDAYSITIDEGEGKHRESAV